MNNLLKKIMLPILFISIGVCIGYFTGLYSGMNSTFLSETTLTAYANIQTLKYIDSNRIDKSKSVLSNALDAEIAAIKDISANKYKLKKIASFYNYFQTMNDLNTNERITNLILEYEKYISEVRENKYPNNN